MITEQSNPVHVLDLVVPEIKSASFIYNFFEPNELIDESLPPVTETTSDADLLKTFRKLPRFNQIEISSNFTRALSTSLDLTELLERIYSQNDLARTTSAEILVQDTEISERVLKTIERSARIRGIDGSLTDISLELSKSVTGINTNLLQSFSSNINSFLNSSFYQNDKKITNEKLIQDRRQSFQINSRYAFDTISTKEKIPFGGYAMSPILNRAIQHQQLSRKTNQFSGGDRFSVELSPIRFDEIATDASNNELFLAGIAVFRQEILPSEGDVFRLLDIIGPNSKNYLDFRIKTNTKYSYFVSNIYLARISSKSSETGESGTADFLFSSSPSNVETLSTIDKVPPPPPSDFLPRWDYQERSLVISWSMPVNPQRDIKYFQVLRRNNIQEPFELLVEYNFNDIVGFVERSDIPVSENERTLTSPLTIFIDNEFRKSSDFIYTLASVDAKGLVSNYSEQLRIRFDSIRNRLVVEQISPSGAPRIYPNAFIKQDLFIDSIITKNIRNATVYFDPEYLKIIDDDNNDLNLILNKEKGRYVLSVIDIDRGQSIKVPLTIQDLREIE